MINHALLKQAIHDISSIQNLEMDPKQLALDVYALSTIFKEETKFENVINSVINAIINLKNNPSIGEDLKYNLAEWKSYHFFSPYPIYPEDEDMRLVYQSVLKNILILGFGHRYIPSDFYSRLSNRI